MSSCSDSGSGSATQPFCSFDSAVLQLQPGDTLRIGSGTYHSQLRLEQLSGTKSAPIVIEAKTGANPVIDGTSIDDYAPIFLYGVEHVTIRGLTVRNSSYFGIVVTSSSGVVVESCKIDGTYHGGLIVENGSSEITLQHNEITRTNTHPGGIGEAMHEAITISNVNGFTVAHNKIHDCEEEGIDAKDGSTGGDVHHNRIERVGSVALYINNASSVTMRDNFVSDVQHHGIMLATGDDAMGSNVTNNNQIYRNVVTNVLWNGIALWDGGGGQVNGNEIKNNTFVNCGQAGAMLWPIASQTSFVNNIFVDTQQGGIVSADGGGVSGQGLISNNLYHQAPGGKVGQGVVTGDPLFVDPGKGDYRLKTGSPAIDAGLGNNLPGTGPPDIGAFEYGSTSPQPDSGLVQPPSDGSPPDPDAGSGAPSSPDQGAGVSPDGGAAAPVPEGDASSPSNEGPGGGQGLTYELAGGCAVAGGESAPPLALLSIALLLFIRRRSSSL